MTNEEAIRCLKEDKALYETSICYAGDGTPDGEMLESLDMAISAIEKQIPKKPDLEGDGYADGAMVYDTWHCPSCDTAYEVDIEDFDYCPHCGQRINWGEQKNDNT